MDATAYAKFLAEFMSESDRAAVVLCAAQIDELLGDILKARLIDPKKDLFEGTAPLATFSARIEIVCAVGVIDRGFANKINLIRKIRNDCAHNVRTIDLDEAPVSQQIDELGKAFSDTEFWSGVLQEAGPLFERRGNSLTLRLAMAMVVANLALIKSEVERIESASARSLIVPSDSLRAAAR